MSGAPPLCPFEAAILAAVRSGRPMDEPLVAHRAVCPGCDDVATVASFLASRIEATRRAQAEGPLPDPGLIWWKAQLAAKRAAAERATRPILWVESAVWAILLLASAGLGIWQAPAFMGAARAFRDQLLGLDIGFSTGAASMTAVAVIGVLPVMVLMAVAVTLRPSFPRVGRSRRHS